MTEVKRRQRAKTGKRSDDRYSQVNFLLPEDLRREFKARAVIDGRDMSDIIEELIREYLKRR